MPNLNQTFGGQTLILPGVYVQNNVSGNNPQGPANTPPLVFIGYGYGTKPTSATSNGGFMTEFTTPQDMKAALRGSPATAFVDFIYNPSNQVNGASIVSYINVSRNTQGTFAMQNGSAAAVLNWTTADYGLPSNLMQVGVVAGTTAGVNVSLLDGYSGKQIVGNNLGVPFNVAYLGAASSVVFSVVGTGNVATQFNIVSSNPGESVTLALGATGYTTIGQVVNYLNGTGYYSATVIGDSTLPSQNLDLVTSVTLPLPVSTVPQFVNVTATLGGIVYWSTQYASAFATAAIASSITSSPSEVPTTIAPTHFSGGTSVPPVLADYAAAFNYALTIPGWVVCTDSNMAGVIALGAQHAVQASGISARSWRRFITGSNVGDTVATAIANAQSMDATQATYVYPGVQRTSTITGLNTVFGGLYAAAAAAGMMAGNPVPMPLTNKALVGNGVEVGITLSQIDQLQQAGVMPIYQAPTNEPTIVSDITSWQLDNNPENCFNQQVAILQGVDYAIYQGMQPYIGGIESPLGIGIKRRAVVAILNSLLYSQQAGTGLLAAWDKGSLVLTWTSTTQTLAVVVGVQPVGQDRFITVTINVEPLTLTA